MSEQAPPPSYHSATSQQTYPPVYAPPAPHANPAYDSTNNSGNPQAPYPNSGYAQQPYPNSGYNQSGCTQAPYPTYETEPQGEGVPKPDDVEGGFAARGFNDKNIRLAFIRKVYLILTAQLMVTCGFICLFQFVKPLKLWVQANSWFYWVSYGTFLVIYIALVCCPTVRRKFPGNFIALTIFTLAFSYMTGTIASYYDTPSVLTAAGITCAVCLGVSIFAMQTRFDFTMCSGIIFILCLVVIFFGFSCMIVYMTIGPNYILQCVYGSLAALLFGLFLAYDTQMILGGRKHELSEEEYIYGALQLYLDIVYLFLIILSCFGSKN